MKKLIITADDYGMCESVNRAIEDCINAGVVLSTNVMVNMPCCEDAALLKNQYPGVSVGLHYNFTVGKPLSPKEQVPSLVDETGNFLSYSEIRKKCKNHSYDLNEVKLEMSAQYRRFTEICGEPDYWNTHENVHVYPGLYRLFRNVSLDLGIKKMRSHQRIFIPSSTGETDKSLLWKLTNPVKQILLNVWQRSSLKKGIFAPDGLLVRMNESDKLYLAFLFSNIQWKNADIAEIAIHPSTSGENEYFGDITDLRVKEYEIFSSTQVKDLAKHCEIELAGFEAVGRKR